MRGSNSAPTTFPSVASTFAAIIVQYEQTSALNWLAPTPTTEHGEGTAGATLYRTHTIDRCDVCSSFRPSSVRFARYDLNIETPSQSAVWNVGRSYGGPNQVLVSRVMILVHSPLAGDRSFVGYRSLAHSQSCRCAPARSSAKYARSIRNPTRLLDPRLF
jgi:hypothetical protein